MTDLEILLEVVAFTHFILGVAVGVAVWMLFEITMRRHA